MAKVKSLFIFLFGLTAMLACTTEGLTQPLPPAGGKVKKQSPFSFANRFQIGVYGGVNLNVYKGIYDGSCPCEFVQSGKGWSIPYGFTVNIPISDESSIYIRTGWYSSSVAFDAARSDSLRSGGGVGAMAEDLTIESDITQLDVLLRLIAEEDGIRLLAGPSFSFVNRTHVELVETEFSSGKKYTIESGELSDARNTRYGFILGIEYAYIPMNHVYVIPALLFNYGVKYISTSQLLRPLTYNFSLSIAYSF